MAYNFSSINYYIFVYLFVTLVIRENDPDQKPFILIRNFV